MGWCYELVGDESEVKEKCLNCIHSYVEDIWNEVQCELPADECKLEANRLTNEI